VSNTYFLADPHIGHRWVAHLRGFETPEEHDEHFRDTWSSHINKRDQVWILGDLHVPRFAHAMDTLASLPGSKNLVFGNHDPGHPMHRDSPRYQRRYHEVFRSVQMAARIKMYGTDLLLSHFPYQGPREWERDLEERYTQWRLPDLGGYLLHGHTHSKNVRTSPREIHVGWDAWGRPVHAKEIADLIQQEGVES
jgi:calcineurin-like phosphoesterase family protein